MSDVDQLAIEAVAYRYAHAVDERDWETFASCLAEDAICDYGHGEPLVGRSHITATVAARVASFDLTQHVVASPQISISGDNARARFHVLAQHVIVGCPGGDFCMVGGVYGDALLRTAAGWVFTHRTVSRQWRQGNLAVLEGLSREG